MGKIKGFLFAVRHREILMTDLGLQRIIGQAGTCYPEFPHVALVIYCDDSAQMETALHAILKLQKKHIESAPGTEWFMTSPEEIEKLYHVLFENQ